MSSPFDLAASEARRLINEHVQSVKQYEPFKEVLRLHAFLNGLEDLLQQERTSLGGLFGLGEISTTATASQLSRVRFDEFVGLPALDAAKKYLKRGSDARPFQEIVDAIKAGGGKIDSEDTLRTGLSRSTLDILKIGDRYGLLEHYPHIKRGGKKRGKVDSDEPSAEPSSEPTQATSVTPTEPTEAEG